MPHVLMYTTEQCPYCVRAKALLTRKGVTGIEEIRIDLHPERQAEMAQKTGGARTVPQIFIGDTYVEGGCDGLHALDRAGKLDPLLAA